MVKSRKDRHIVEKTWGEEDWIVNNEKYCGKRMFLRKGTYCSWHFHKIKEESFFCVSGTMVLRYGYDEDISKATEITMNPGDSFDIPVGMIHQFEGLEDTVFFEFSTQHFDEDSIRISVGGIR